MNPIWAYWVCFAPGSQAGDFLSFKVIFIEIQPSLRDLIKDIPYNDGKLERMGEEKSPAPSWIQTQDLLIMRRCATTTA